MKINEDLKEKLGRIVQIPAIIINLSEGVDLRKIKEPYRENNIDGISKRAAELVHLLDRFYKAGISYNNVQRMIIERTGDFFDMHDSAGYRKGCLKNYPLMYLGVVEEQLIVEHKNNIHYIYTSRSDDRRRKMLSYPLDLQPEESSVYTRGNITWYDFRAQKLPGKLNMLEFLVKNQEKLTEDIIKGRANYHNLNVSKI